MYLVSGNMSRTRCLLASITGMLSLTQCVMADLKIGQLNDAQKIEVVDAHNYFRRLENAANMNKIVS